MNGQGCTVNGDCTSNYCNAMMTCAAATCNDGIQNGTETGVDCGGSCPKCNGSACTSNTECVSTVCYAGTCVANVNNCTLAGAMDLTGGSMTTVTFPNGNFTYAPKCIKVKVNTVVTLTGSFAGHPLEGGIVSGGVTIPAAGGPFIPVTNTGATKDFTMTATGTFPSYCQPHALGGMNGAVFVVP
jgi:plastocyanin